MKKFMSLILILLGCVMVYSLTACDMSNTLLILNWGEYISDDVVERFEEKYGVTVSISIADSNELFYSKVKSGTTAYDLVVPSDYMVQKMADNGMIQEIDFTKLSNYNPDDFLPGVKNIIDGMNSDPEKDYTNYFVPYLWGTFGLMYNKKADGLEELVTKYGWEGYFESDKIPDTYRIGMYNAPRFTYAACMFYAACTIDEDISPNDYDDSTISIFKQVINQRKFYSWGNDTLKKGVQAGNLDLAFVYTGDFLDMLYATVDTVDELENITFDIYIPSGKNTIAFMDTLVMPTNARHKDLAYKFIDFMLEEESAYDNASVVGYCTPFESVYDKIVSGKDSDDEWLQVWGTVVEKYYPKDEIRGTMLTYFSETQLKTITNIVNNAKIS